MDLKKWLSVFIEKGVFEEDPDGVVYLSPKMKEIVDTVEADNEIMELLDSKAENLEDWNTGLWTYIYSRFVGDEGCTSRELTAAVNVLKRYNWAVKNKRLREWSMRLRVIKG